MTARITVWRSLVALAALAGSFAAGPPGVGAEGPAAAAAPAVDLAAVRFEVVDVFVDAGDRELAAYQVKLTAAGADVRLVSLEGGDHAAFAAPPYYDKQALMAERVIVAAYSTGADLPRGRTRVCRLHVQVTGDAATYAAELQAAAGPDGTTIEAKVSAAVGG